jgi:glycosyltransferase involved in cell wall biosynthesis
LETHKKQILFVLNSAQFFLSHRQEIALEAQRGGFEVSVATPDSELVSEIIDLGFNHYPIAFKRGGQNPFQEIFTLFRLTKILLRCEPSLLYLTTIKPILYGGIIAKFLRLNSVVIAVSGLGSVFLSETKFGALRKFIVLKIYKFVFKNDKARFIFQNRDDLDFFTKMCSLPASRVHLIAGAGVCLQTFGFVKEPEGQPVVTMASRLIRDKGVLEFIEASKLLKTRGVHVKMQLIGSPDNENPTSVIVSEYQNSNIICLPSYREGLPKALLEAASCGRAIITTNVPGCRDAIIPGKTGLLVPKKDSASLANAIERLCSDVLLRKKMGSEGRVLAEKKFDVRVVSRQTREVFQQSLHDRD